MCFVSSISELKFLEFLNAPKFLEYPSIHRDLDSLAMGQVNNTDLEFGSGGGDQMVLDGQGFVCVSLFLAIAAFILHPPLKLGSSLACHCQSVEEVTVFNSAGEGQVQDQTIMSTFWGSSVL